MRERRYFVAEEEIVVGFAKIFNQRAWAYAPPMLDRRPGHVESARIVDGDEYLQRLAAVDHLEALDDVQLLSVRRAIIVDECLSMHPFSIDAETPCSRQSEAKGRAR